MLHWFETELAKAHAKAHAVWVIGHIPGGLFQGDWLLDHELRYQRLMEKYSQTIQGQFYGHKHEDHAKVTRKCNEAGICDGDPTGIVWIGPSLTEGWPAANPGIRQYLYSADGTSSRARYAITDSLTYTTDLLEANKAGHVTWRMEYSMRQTYNMSDLTARSWLAVVERMRTDSKTWEKHFALRRKLYNGPLSYSSWWHENEWWSGDCSDHHLACAKPLICEMMFFQARLVSNCTKPETEIDHTFLQDKHPKCHTWAKNGECTKNPKFMNLACRSSCRHSAAKAIQIHIGGLEVTTSDDMVATYPFLVAITEFLARYKIEPWVFGIAVCFALCAVAGCCYFCVVRLLVRIQQVDPSLSGGAEMCISNGHQFQKVPTCSTDDWGADSPEEAGLDVGLDAAEGEPGIEMGPL